MPGFLRRRVRTSLLGLSTFLGIRRVGYFIPTRYAAANTPPHHYPALERLFTARRQAFVDVLAAVDAQAAALTALGAAPPPEPRWHQDWFPRLDAAAAYALVRQLRPARIVEIGAGHSTRWFVRALRDAGCPVRVAAIDPQPRAELAGLPITLLRTTVQRAGTAPFAALAAGDILSLDGSHILMPGSDADIVLNQLLPALPDGVIVHIHDIFLPDAYPAAWAWRAYNEQQGVAALLQGGGYEMLWSSHWVATRLAERLATSVAARLPLLPGAHEASLWLRKRGGAVQL